MNTLKLVALYTLAHSRDVLSAWFIQLVGDNVTSATAILRLQDSSKSLCTVGTPEIAMNY